MDLSESTKVVYDRIQKLEPENVKKILGYLLLRNIGQQEMFRLALGPDKLIEEVIQGAKAELQQLPFNSDSHPISPSSNNTFGLQQPMPFLSSSYLSSQRLQSPFKATYWDPQLVSNHLADSATLGYQDSIADIQNQLQLLSLENRLEEYNLGISDFSNEGYYADSMLGNSRVSARCQNLPDFPVKTCHYFNKGYCKHGSNCRYLHEQVSPDDFSRMLGPGPHDIVNDEQFYLSGSLEQLELEIIGILKSKKGSPLSIASLPMVYYERYGKVLQGQGYLTESQRHGKAGHSLTRLLSRLDGIRLIDRPHGQHALVLAEDAAKFLENRNDKHDGLNSKSRQIYLTFPAESTFSEEDVSNYFSKFGPVEDVRIPSQQKRMFGFVTFVNPDTVHMILSKGNPHFVCGARVLVKPYKEKSKLLERKYLERMEPAFHAPRFLDMEHELHSIPRGYEASKILRHRLMEYNEEILAFERRRLGEIQLAHKPHQFKVPKDYLSIPSTECVDYLLDVFNTSQTDDQTKHTETTNYNDQESEGVDLPENPFSLPVASSISTQTKQGA